MLAAPLKSTCGRLPKSVRTALLSSHATNASGDLRSDFEAFERQAWPDRSRELGRSEPSQRVWDHASDEPTPTRMNRGNTLSSDVGY